MEGDKSITKRNGKIAYGSTFVIEVAQPDIGEFKTTTNTEYTGFNNNHLILDLGSFETKGKLISVLKIYNKSGEKDIDILGVSGSCGCVSPSSSLNKDGSYNIKLNIDMTRMNKGVENTKVVTIYLKNKKEIKIKIKVYGL